jgi:hypothetical protein
MLAPPAMHSLPEMNDERLYDRLEAAVEQACISIRLLSHRDDSNPPTPDALSLTVQRSSEIAREIEEHLVRAVVASLPKVDFEALSRLFAAIPVAAERYAAQAGLAARQVSKPDFSPALAWIEELCELVSDMVRQLRGFESLERIKQLHPRVETLADRAEAVVDETVTQVYKETSASLDALRAKDLGACLQVIIDNCREAGERMQRISLNFL